MTSTESSPVPPTAPKWLPLLLLAAVPVVCFVVGGIFLPAPKSAAEARANVDRSRLQGIVLSERPTPKNPVDAVLGDRIRVLGADLPDTPLSRGRGLGIHFYFEALREMDRDWTVFVHIDREGGTYRIHGDHSPADGVYHTSLWQPGEHVKDPLDKLVPIDAPPGRYDVWLGFYIGDERLPFSKGDGSIHDGTNRVRVGQIVIQ